MVTYETWDEVQKPTFPIDNNEKGHYMYFHGRIPIMATTFCMRAVLALKASCSLTLFLK